MNVSCNVVHPMIIIHHLLLRSPSSGIPDGPRSEQLRRHPHIRLSTRRVCLPFVLHFPFFLTAIPSLTILPALSYTSRDAGTEASPRC